ncbi:hypothetical protein AMAG_14328 [Allomyces macrogynus ATCC 38327]|uniref:Cytochrome b561 domain-containing protein n=1 Tax=Allomyces macrogynus (strain ATCC 38327) TaxID=578462 RepID=A0A0L0T4X2_ALLM3|nr:hypothetical protein AMAG_14328 [Allomyces macrogynus ATCC 38327]|eukprot:KNE69792.1 hypothetical protein AMAG_14328 [Allomyces macrogynus ATCC 38327]
MTRRPPPRHQIPQLPSRTLRAVGILSLAALVLLAVTVHAVPTALADAPTRTASSNGPPITCPHEKLCVQMARAPTGDAVDVAILTSVAGWIAVGLGSSMGRADVLMLWQESGKWTVSHRHSTARTLPPAARNQNAHVVSATPADSATGMATVVVRRPIAAEAPGDLAFENTDQWFVWALYDSEGVSASALPFHEAYGSFQYNALAYASPEAVPKPEPTPTPSKGEVPVEGEAPAKDVAPVVKRPLEVAEKCVDPMLCVSMHVVPESDGNAVDMTIRTSVKGWVAIGLGSNMRQADVLMLWRESGKWTVSHRHSTARTLPGVAQFQNANVTSVIPADVPGGMTMIVVRRPAKADHSLDQAFVDQDQPFIWAYADREDVSATHLPFHNKWGKFMYNALAQRGALASAPAPTPAPALAPVPAPPAVPAVPAPDEQPHKKRPELRLVDKAVEVCPHERLCVRMARAGKSHDKDVELVVKTDIKGWVAVGLGSSMQKADVLMLWRENGKWTVSHRHSTARLLPLPAPHANVHVVASTADTVTLRRPIAAKHDRDMAFENATQSFVWAFFDGDNVSAQRLPFHDAYGTFEYNAFAVPVDEEVTATPTPTPAPPATTAAPTPAPTVAIPPPPPALPTSKSGLTSDGSYTYEEQPEDAGATEKGPSAVAEASESNAEIEMAIRDEMFRRTMLTVHAVVMSVAWTGASFAGISIARFMKHRLPTKWFPLHRAVFLLVAALTVTGTAAALVATPTGAHFHGKHGKLGLALVVGTLLQTALGFVIDALFDAERARAPWWDKVHWVLGMSLGVAGPANVFLGHGAWGTATTWVAVHAVVVAAAVAGFIWAQCTIGQQHEHDPAVRRVGAKVSYSLLQEGQAPPTANQIIPLNTM